MFKVFILVRNFHSPLDRLEFGDFTAIRIDYPLYCELREQFSSQDVGQNDWLFEKTYPASSACVGCIPKQIPDDIADILLLLRLFKVGDVAFVTHRIRMPDGETQTPSPSRLMNNVNSSSVLMTDLTQEDCERWTAFAKDVRASRSWGSQWFSVARRFFLYGGAKEFNPMWDEVDRIVDYATALEAAVAPETDFSRRRMSFRSAKLVSADPSEQEAIANIVKRLYDVRSSIVHGGSLSDKQRQWLIANCHELEHRVRQVLIAAIRNVPSDEAERRTMLSILYDPADSDRGQFALQKFQEIRTEPVRTEVAARISAALAPAPKHSPKNPECDADDV